MIDEANEACGRCNADRCGQGEANWKRSTGSRCPPPFFIFCPGFSVNIVIVIVVWILSRKNVSLDSRRGV